MEGNKSTYKYPKKKKRIEQIDFYKYLEDWWTEEELDYMES